MEHRYEYIYGSAAPKLDEHPQQPEKQVRKNTPVKKKLIKTESETFPLVQMVICIILVFGILFTIIYRYSTITEMNFALSSLNKEYESLKDNNRKLQVDIGARINQENIRKVAEERLNMKMPDSYQKIPVMVSKINYSTVTQVEEEDKKISLKSLLMIFGFN